jgi:hypothetical protein
MKVLSYLEVMKCPTNDGFAWIVNNMIEDLSVMNVEDFYSQPFKPELITELFEGWEWNGENVSSNETLIVDISWQSDYLVITFIEKDIYFFFPRTLDDFITDCQRAGIELTWREQ